MRVSASASALADTWGIGRVLPGILSNVSEFIELLMTYVSHSADSSDVRTGELFRSLEVSSLKFPE